MPAGRFAPSPTAPLHLGNLRTALLAWLFARSTGAAFYLRVEDLDRQACRREFEQSHIDDLRALGLEWDGVVVRQSERFDRYHAAIDRLTEAGVTYPCYCTRREVLDAAAAPHEHLPEGAYPGTCRDLDADERSVRDEAGRRAALRLRAGAVRLGFDDAVHGYYEGGVDDFVIRRNDGTPAYNLAVVVDDAEQRVEQVVRGDDLLAGTPRHLHLAQLLGLAAPSYAHVPLVLGPDGERLSKRHGAVTLAARAALGESPAQVRSRLAASLGLSDQDEPVTPTKLLERFDAARVPTRAWRLPPL